jgi:hypothetical protein
MKKVKEKIEDGPLAEYWPLFVEGLIGGILTLYLISLGGLASLCGILILIGEIGTAIYSASQGEFKFLVVLIITNSLGGSNAQK